MAYPPLRYNHDMDYWVCLECEEKFPALFDEHEKKCPYCKHPMKLHKNAVTPITPDLPKILTGLVPKNSD